MAGGPHRLIAGVLLAGGVGWLAAVLSWTTPARSDLFPPRPGQPAVEFHLLDNGFHTDLAVPRAALEGRAGPLGDAARGLAPGDWVLIGWGDARFYVDQRPIHYRLPDGARAFFAPGNPSVVMLDPEIDDPRRLWAEDGRRSLMLSAAGFEAMARRIEAALSLTDGRATVAALRPGDDARFFSGTEAFWIGHLCNHWTAQVLAAGGVPVRPARSITSGEVMRAVGRAEADRAERDRAQLDRAAPPA